jgi:hypothetical protein
MLFSSNLSYAPLNDAFNITTESIIKQQNEINSLKQNLINNNQPVIKTESVIKTEPVVQVPNNNTEQKSTFSAVQEEPESFETTFLKLIKNPNFDDLFFKYINTFKPDLLKKNYINGISEIKSNSKETFGNNNSPVTNYIIFFIISAFVYLLLFLLFKK